MFLASGKEWHFFSAVSSIPSRKPHKGYLSSCLSCKGRGPDLKDSTKSPFEAKIVGSGVGSGPGGPIKRRHSFDLRGRIRIKLEWTESVMVQELKM